MATTIRYAAWSKSGGFPCNEDALLVHGDVHQGVSIWATNTVTIDKPAVFACADGLHIGPGAAWASRTLLELLRDSYLTFPSWSPQARIQWLQSTLTENGQRYPGAASTLLWAELQETRLTLCHVGDSRAWLIRDGGVKLLTEDQTVATDLRNAGYAADNHPLLASSYGALAEYFSVDAFVDVPHAVTQSMPFKEGDLLLLGTDGIAHLELPEIMILAAELIARANSSSGQPSSLSIRRSPEGPDNRSVILISNHGGY